MGRVDLDGLLDVELQAAPNHPLAAYVIVRHSDDLVARVGHRFRRSAGAARQNGGQYQERSKSFHATLMLPCPNAFVRRPKADPISDQGTTKNSAMFPAVAAAPGNCLRPSASPESRNVLSCWYREADW